MPVVVCHHRRSTVERAMPPSSERLEVGALSTWHYLIQRFPFSARIGRRRVSLASHACFSRRCTPRRPRTAIDVDRRCFEVKTKTTLVTTTFLSPAHTQQGDNTKLCSRRRRRHSVRAKINLTHPSKNGASFNQIQYHKIVCPPASPAAPSSKRGRG